jgi:hypothetical protein
VRVGYARMSRQNQKLEPQRDALLADGCERVFEEKVSSREADRKVLREAFNYCREGDVLVVARLDRLGRSLRERYRGAPDGALWSSCGVLGGRADGATVLAPGQHALGLALQLPHPLARDPQLVAQLGQRLRLLDT